MNAFAEYARLDQIGTEIVPRLKPNYAREFVNAALHFGSVSKMPEPFKSWCENPAVIDPMYLESE